ncbi:formamidase [Blastococcus sp. TF02-09]|uniref:formamidase n=1 Tax=Blastococcus sp. TF02-09 TaxID=2250576 RepID=UPI000DE921C0|nr:formamidase [Blastococcus sp. TF02-9]RBY78630.1 formamidase [Blastococcus sp. TF02-9]
MTGLGGLNPSPGAMVLGLVQQQVPIVNEPADLKAAAEKIAGMVTGAKAGMPTLDLLVFPEYGLHGLNPKSWLRDDLLCDLDGPEVEVLRGACTDSSVWGCFSLMERNPDGAPYNSGIIVDADGEIVLYYRKMHPMVPLEPWEPGDVGIPVCAGPAGSTLALIICHDGNLPEMAREAAYKGANVILRTAGYTDPIRHSWRITNQVNAFTNLAYTASVALTGADATGIWSIGEAMICDVDGTVLEQGDNSPDRIVTGEVVPARADEARRGWGVENNIYQLGHRGYVAVRGGATDCPYTYMTDLAAGRYQVPWEDEVEITDGTSVGYGPPREPGSTTETHRTDAPRQTTGG